MHLQRPYVLSRNVIKEIASDLTPPVPRLETDQAGHKVVRTGYVCTRGGEDILLTLEGRIGPNRNAKFKYDVRYVASARSFLRSIVVLTRSRRSVPAH